MKPLISVIVPIYNAEKYLDRCVKSILNQTYKNLEIILVDDGSSDGSFKKCDEYSLIDNRIKVIHKTNGGVCSARNAGLNICTGDYIGFVDSDDWIDPLMYETLLDMCKDYRTIGTIGSYQVLENGNKLVKRNFLNKDATPEEFLHNVLCRIDGCAVWSRLFPREVIGNNRFNESRLNEEILFWIDLLPQIQRVRYTSSMSYYYFQHSGSLSSSFGKSIHDMIENAIEMRNFVDREYPSLSKEAERFEIYQNMSFLLACPSNYDRDRDVMYEAVLSYIKKNRLRGVKNPFFTIKEKLLLLALSTCPRTITLLLEFRNNGVR